MHRKRLWVVETLEGRVTPSSTVVAPNLHYVPMTYFITTPPKVAPPPTNTPPNLHYVPMTFFTSGPSLVTPADLDRAAAMRGTAPTPAAATAHT